MAGKFAPPRNPLLKEGSLKTIEPPDRQVREAKQKFYIKGINDAPSAAVEHAWAKKFVDMLDKQHTSNLNQEFKDDFISWCLGRSRYNYADEHGHPTPWGTQDLLHIDPVREFLESHLEARLEFQRGLVLLSTFGPGDSLENAYLYFKYIVMAADYYAKHKTRPPWYDMDGQLDFLDNFKLPSSLIRKELPDNYDPEEDHGREVFGDPTKADKVIITNRASDYIQNQLDGIRNTQLYKRGAGNLSNIETGTQYVKEQLLKKKQADRYRVYQERLARYDEAIADQMAAGLTEEQAAALVTRPVEDTSELTVSDEELQNVHVIHVVDQVAQTQQQNPSTGISKEELDELFAKRQEAYVVAVASMIQAQNTKLNQSMQTRLNVASGAILDSVTQMQKQIQKEQLERETQLLERNYQEQQHLLKRNEATVRDMLARYDAEMQSFRGTIAEREQRDADFQSDLNKIIQASAAQIAEVNINLLKQEGTSRQTIEQVATLAAQLRDQNQQALHRATEQKAAYESMATELEKLRRQSREQTEAQVQASRAFAEEMARMRARGAQDVQEYRQGLIQLRQITESQEELIARLQGHVTLQREEVNTITRKRDEAQAKLTEAQAIQAQKDAELAQRVAAIANYESQLLTIKQENTEARAQLETQIAALQQEKAIFERQVQLAHEDIVAQRTELARNAAAMEINNARMDTLAQEITVLRLQRQSDVNLNTASANAALAAAKTQEEYVNILKSTMGEPTAAELSRSPIGMYSLEDISTVGALDASLQRQQQQIAVTGLAVDITGPMPATQPEIQTSGGAAETQAAAAQLREAIAAQRSENEVLVASVTARYAEMRQQVEAMAAKGEQGMEIEQPVIEQYLQAAAEAANVGIPLDLRDVPQSVQRLLTGKQLNLFTAQIAEIMMREPITERLSPHQIQTHAESSIITLQAGQSLEQLLSEKSFWRARGPSLAKIDAVDNLGFHFGKDGKPLKNVLNVSQWEHVLQNIMNIPGLQATSSGLMTEGDQSMYWGAVASDLVTAQQDALDPAEAEQQRQAIKNFITEVQYGSRVVPMGEINPLSNEEFKAVLTQLPMTAVLEIAAPAISFQMPKEFSDRSYTPLDQVIEFLRSEDVPLVGAGKNAYHVIMPDSLASARAMLFLLDRANNSKTRFNYDTLTADMMTKMKDESPMWQKEMIQGQLLAQRFGYTLSDLTKEVKQKAQAELTHTYKIKDTADKDDAKFYKPGTVSKLGRTATENRV